MKKIFLTSKTLIASFLVVIITGLTGRFFGVTGFSFAWVLNFTLMAWFTYINSIYKFPLKSSYFKSRSWERNTRIYNLLGITYFKKLLVLTGWEKITRKENPIKKDPRSLKLLVNNSRSSEFGHLVIAIIVLIFTVIVSHTLKDAMWLLITNILLNIYPVLLQRYNRQRYERFEKYFETESV